MGGAFSSSSNHGSSKQRSAPPSSITDVDRAMLDLKNARDRLTKYNRQLETSMDKLVQRAVVAKKEGKTQTALGLLRLKKYKQSQVASVQAQLLTVHELIGTIQSTQHNAQLVATMKAGKDALAQLHAETTVDDVLDLMDGIAEQNAVEQEISDVLSNAVGTALSAEQEADVEQELAALEAELAPVATVPDMPKVPTDKLPEILPTQPEAANNNKQPERVAVAS